MLGMGLGLGVIPRVQKLWWRFARPITRAWQTRFYSLGKVALGEPLYKGSEFPREWIHVDWKDADYRVDLARSRALPFRDGSQKIIYSAHLIEHLPEPRLEELLRECCRVLEPGGRIRFECPDAEKLVELYRKADPHMLSHFRRFRRETIVGLHGFEQKYLEDHLSLLGEISNFIIPGHAFHMPVYAPRQVFEEKLERLDLDSFGEWCLSLQTPEQKRSGGHQNILYFSKLERMLEAAGFTNIVRGDFDATTIPEIRLNESGRHGVRAKLYRRFYSLYVEATKPSSRVSHLNRTAIVPGRAAE
jgi:SAM-dependent methyltransferase